MRTCIITMPFLLMTGLMFKLALPVPNHLAVGQMRRSVAIHVDQKRDGQGSQEISRTEPPRQMKSHLAKGQVQSLVREEFGGLFLIDEGMISPSYLIGDFNGDGVDDIAILARPRDEVDPNDKSEPPFWLDKAAEGGKAPANAGRKAKQGKKYARYRFKMGNLAPYREGFMPVTLIIHGAPQRMWSNSKQEQRFVVLDAMNFDVTKMHLYRGKLESATLGDRGIEPPPDLKGDAILFTFRGVGNIVYWDGNGYYSYPFEPSCVSCNNFDDFRPRDRFANLRKWENRYPIDNTITPPRNFFNLPAISMPLLWLLGQTDYERLLRDFEVTSPITLSMGFLVMIGSTSKKDADGHTESALVAVGLRDTPVERGVICVGFSMKNAEIQIGDTEWRCTRGEYVLGEGSIIPLEIRAKIDAEALRELNRATSVTTEPAIRYPDELLTNIEQLAVHKVSPEYPPIAQGRAIQGKVRVRATISEEGHVLEAEAIRGHDMLREAATKAARQWKFTPAKKDGVPVKLRGVLDFQFVLR